MATVETSVRLELLDASDETIEDAVGYADPMVLRGLLYQLTGDDEVAATKVGTSASAAGFSAGVAPATEEDVALLRRKTVEFLKAYRDAGAGEITIGPEERLGVSMALAAGWDLKPEAIEFWSEELAIDPWARGLEWQQAPPKQREDFSVTIIGAGMGGLNAAIQLKHAGLPYTVIERNSGVGGVWFENHYPGARVDSPSRLYTHIFGVDYSYPSAFCPWTENQKYFDWVADNFDIRDDIVFDTEVRAMVWDDESSTWEIEIDGPDGQRTLRSHAVISAVGFLNRPNIPEIEGMADFEGPSWHSARWPEDIDLTNKRVAVIGTGCTGYQMIPELALEVGHVSVFQRTPQWLFAMPGYRSPFPPQANWLDRNLPYHTNFMRFRSVSGFGLAFAGAAEIDPDFDDPYAVSLANKRVRDGCIEFLEQKLGDPELVAKMTPLHPVLSERPVLVDPDYSVLDAIQRDNVSLVTDGIRRITKTGIETSDGTQYEVDVIVYATGFHATEYLVPMTITGRGGQTVDELWADSGARAYLGAMIPGFPNFWTIYGPNTNGGLLPPAFHEMGTVYALRCIERLILDDKKSIDVKEDAYWRYNEIIDERNARRAWSDPRAHHYYWTKKFGRSATQCPLTGIEMWNLLRQPKFEELQIR
jgi:4-hydroxyacetophenone monooxygenase